MNERTYRVVVTREGRAWLADVPEVPGAHTWARSLPGLDRAVREVVALVRDLPRSTEAKLLLAYEYDLGDPTLNAVTRELRAERERIQQAERQLTERTAELANVLVERQLSVRDAATLLSVSPQRVSQLAARKPRATKVVKADARRKR